MIKNIFKYTLIYMALIFSFIWFISYAISWPTNSPLSETNWWLLANIFNKILLDTWSLSDWTVKITEKVVNQDCWLWKFLQWFDSNWNKICVIPPSTPCTVWTNYLWWKCAWQINWYNLISTPSWCTNSTTPTCNWWKDSVTKSWGANNIITWITSSTNWEWNTIALVTNYTDTYAAQFCYNMIYWWYSDWYLPSKDELIVLYTNQNMLWWFQTGLSYYSSTEVSSTVAWNQDFNADPMSTTKTKPYYIRCVRKSSN